MPPLAPLALALLAAARLHHRLGIKGLAVLAGEAGLARVLAGAEVGRVDQEALLAALHFEDEARYRDVGDVFVITRIRSWSGCRPPLGQVQRGVGRRSGLRVW